MGKLFISLYPSSFASPSANFVIFPSNKIKKKKNVTNSQNANFLHSWQNSIGAKPGDSVASAAVGTAQQKKKTTDDMFGIQSTFCTN